MAIKRHVTAGFLNVDLEVSSPRPLDLLATSLGGSVDVLFLGQQGSDHVAALELAGSGWQRTPDPIIVELIDLIKRLPEGARMVWDTASERRFDIGCEAPHGPDALALELKSSTVAAIAEVNGTIGITVYRPGGAQLRVRKRRQKHI